ncbi:Hypothetical protein SRAE_2000210500 [Strongyloides ratti]|uniref:Uncharacterized protein n=1 Tax=Strongyloides ratti TaxID=34506 RepID=A0A090LCB5_STRRB|nr:Hypothetical protein SRAE_2000210500 [Strongyloides ratti]CEF67441.1 Hypothetical protein SRAE_2000210500 [Strongyloides ratti]
MSDMDFHSITLTEDLDNTTVTINSGRDTQIEEVKKYILESIKNQFPDGDYHASFDKEINKTSNIPLQPILQHVIDNQNYYSRLYLKCIEESTKFVKQLHATTNVLFDSCNLKKEEEIIKKINNKSIINNNDGDCKVIGNYVKNIFEDFEISQKKYDDIKKLTDTMKNLLNMIKKEI